eukprot:gene25975-biopygen12497
MAGRGGPLYPHRPGPRKRLETRIASRCLETTKASLYTLHFSDLVRQVGQVGQGETGGTIEPLIRPRWDKCPPWGQETLNPGDDAGVTSPPLVLCQNRGSIVTLWVGHLSHPECDI